MQAKTKIILVDDHPVVRQGIKMIIESEKDLVVCGEAGTANEAIDVICKKDPHIVIIDIMLKGNINGIELVKSINERFPDIVTLVLSMYDDSIYAERAIRAGARGYIMKEVAPKQVITAIRTILEGKLYLDNDLSKNILDKLLHGSTDASGLSIDALSDREFEIFHLIGNGYTSKEISNKLNISVFTVESHKRNIREKYKLKNSSELLKCAIQWELSQK